MSRLHGGVRTTDGRSQLIAATILIAYATYAAGCQGAGVDWSHVRRSQSKTAPERAGLRKQHAPQRCAEHCFAVTPFEAACGDNPGIAASRQHCRAPAEDGA